MRKTIFVLNGPNLNLLGEREPEIYGRTTLAGIRQMCAARAKVHGLGLEFRQTNFEGTLIESVQEARKAAAGIIINPAGLSFTSVALLDSLTAEAKRLATTYERKQAALAALRESLLHRAFAGNL